MKKETPSVKNNFIFNVILTVSNVIFPFLTFPYVSRVLGPAGTGKVEFAASIVYYFNIFAQLGIPTYGIRACAAVRDDREQLSKTVQELFTINLIMAVISYLFLIIAVFSVNRFQEEKLLILIISITIFFNLIGIDWLYRGMERYSYITTRTIIFKLIAVLAMFILVHKESDYIVYGAVTIFAGSASGILNFYNSRKYIDWKKRPLNLRKHLKPIIVFFAMSVAVTIYTNLDTVMLGFMKTDADVGLYNVAVKIKNILMALVTSLGTVILPRASYYVEHNEMDKFRLVTRKAFDFVLILSTALTVFFVLFARESIILIAGIKFEGAVHSMQIIMPTLLLIGLTNISGIQILVPLKKEKCVLYSEITGAIVDVVLNCLLIPKFGAAGAAIGTLAAEFAVLIVQFCCISEEIRAAFSSFKWFEFFITLIVSSVLVCLVRTIVFNSAVLYLVIMAIIFFGSGFICLLFFKEPMIEELKNEAGILLKKIFNK